MRVAWRVVALVLLAGGAFYLYQLGVDHGRGDVATLSAALQRAEQHAADAARTIARLESERARVEAGLADSEARYRHDLPQGARLELLARLDERLAAGVAPERLRQVIAATENDRACEPPVTRRLVVRTPLVHGGATSVSFADNQLTVIADGTPARDAQNNPEAWFDPEKPVTVQFVSPAGRAGEASGRLPLQHAIVIGDFEYRFQITAGGRGALNVTGDRCKYP